MADTIQLQDKVFRVMIPAEKISEAVENVAAQLNERYKGRTPVFLGVLSGSFLFLSDLVRKIEFDNRVAFVKLSSYDGTQSTGEVKQHLGVDFDIEGQDIIIVEDIVDTGLTMHKMLETLEEKKPASLAVASLFLKPARLRVPVEVKYSAFEIPDRFIVGYGLDYDELYRNLPYVGILKREVYE